MVSKTVYDIGREVCLKKVFFLYHRKFRWNPFDMKKSWAGSHCGGSGNMSQKRPVAGGESCKSDSFLYIYRDTKNDEKLR